MEKGLSTNARDRMKDEDENTPYDPTVPPLYLREARVPWACVQGF